jgi:hypothetical protein
VLIAGDRLSPRHFSHGDRAEPQRFAVAAPVLVRCKVVGAVSVAMDNKILRDQFKRRGQNIGASTKLTYDSGVKLDQTPTMSRGEFDLNNLKWTASLTTRYPMGLACAKYYPAQLYPAFKGV